MIKKTIHITALLLLLAPIILFSQSPAEDCFDLLEKAEHDFKIGKIDRVEDRIKPCLDKQLTNTLRREILELLIETALFMDEDQKAEAYYADLKFLDPFIKLNDLVPENKYLADKFETFPATTYTLHYGGSPNLVPINMDEIPQGISLSSLDLGRNKGTPFGWFLGAEAAFNISNSRFDASISYTFHNNFTHYQSNLLNAFESPGFPVSSDHATISFREQSHWSQLSLGLVYQFKKRDRFEKRLSPYIYVKFGGNYLHNSFPKLLDLSAVYRYPDNETSKTDPTISIGDMRSKFFVSFKTGAALRLRLYRHFFIMGGVEYHRILTDLAEENPNAENYKLLLDNYNFQEDSFTAHQFGFFGGFGFYLFKTKKKD